MEPERRFFEFRQVEGRVLEGVAITYRAVARLPFGRERFLPGAFGDAARLDVVLNVQHDRRRPIARTGGGGLRLVDSEQSLSIHADLPESRDADDVLSLVRSKVLRGLSIEFLPVTEGLVDGIREIARARLSAVAVVDRPAYTGSQVSARQEQNARRLFWL